MARSAEEIALAAVEKALKEEAKAQDKADAAEKKYAELKEAAKRAARTTAWTASHPDLPEDFDVNDFAKSLEEPFAEEGDGPDLEPQPEPDADDLQPDTDFRTSDEDDDPFGEGDA